MKMRFVRGSIAAGFSRVIRTSRPRPGESSTCMRAVGRANRYVRTSSHLHGRENQYPGASSRPSSRQRSPAKRCASSTNTHVGVPGPTGARSASCQSLRPVRGNHGIVPFERLVDQVMSQPPYNQARRVFWLWITARRIAVSLLWQRLTQAHPRLVPVHGRCTRAGSTRSRSTSPCSAQGAHTQRLQLAWRQSPSVSKTSSATTRASPSLRVEIHPH